MTKRKAAASESADTATAPPISKPETTTLEEAQAVGVINQAYPGFNPEKWLEFDMVGHSGIAYVITEGPRPGSGALVYGVTVAEMKGFEAVPRGDLSMAHSDYDEASKHVNELWAKFGSTEEDSPTRTKTGKPSKKKTPA
jgi:hypothetical protein